MPSIRSFVCLSGVVAVGLFSSALEDRTACAAPFSDLFVFGDSFSDSGNVFAATGGFIPADPPYFQGRFSDGPVWAERLAERLGLNLVANGDDPNVILGNNFAVGGARTAVDVPVPIFGAIPSVVSQIDAFTTALQPAPSDALYVVFSGHNDLRFAVDPDEGLGPEEREQLALDAVEGLRTAVTMLADAGARIFLVPNVADLGRTPEAIVVRENAVESTALTIRFNQELESAVGELEASLGVTIVQLDAFALGEAIFEDALQNEGETYGIKNVEVPIFPGFAGSPGAPPETSLFADDLHISAVAHALLGDAAFATVEASGLLPGGSQFPGDCNQDGSLDLSDGVCLFGFLFLGTPRALPCGGDQGNLTLADFNGDQSVDLSDGISVLNFLFQGGPPHVLGTACVEIAGCEEVCLEAP